MILRLTLPRPVKRMYLSVLEEKNIFEESLQSNNKLYDDLDEDDIQFLNNRIQALEMSLQNARQEAFQLGFEEGQKAVESKYRHAIEVLPRELAQAVNSLQRQYDEAISRFEKPLVKLSLVIAEKILKYHLQIEDNRREFFTQQLAYFLRVLSEEQKITIYLAPNQMAYTRQSSFIHNFKGKIIFVEDGQLQPGECLLETDEFIIDGTISGQLEQIARELIGDEN